MNSVPDTKSSKTKKEKYNIKRRILSFIMQSVNVKFTLYKTECQINSNTRQAKYL